MPRALAPAAAGWLAAVALFSACHNHKTGVTTPSGQGGSLTVSIGASATSGRAPLDVAFTSDVHGGDGPYRYLWTFGDGRTSTAAAPRVQFPSGGAFDVTLQVWSGDQTATSSAINIRLDSDVRLSCSADPVEAIAPVAVSFRADAQGGNGTFTYRWDFGDGSSTTATSAVHTYAAAGTYRQVLTVSSGGASAVCSNVVTVYGLPFRVTCRATPKGGTAVQFHAIPSFCLFNQCAYSWSFGGPGSGSSVLTARPLFTYAAEGTYTAHLDASTAGGRQAGSCQVTVTVP